MYWLHMLFRCTSSIMDVGPPCPCILDPFHQIIIKKKKIVSSYMKTYVISMHFIDYGRWTPLPMYSRPISSNNNNKKNNKKKKIVSSYMKIYPSKPSGSHWSCVVLCFFQGVGVCNVIGLWFKIIFFIF